MNNMPDNIEQVYFTSEQLSEIVKNLGERISADYAGGEVLLICVLKGSLIFTADLMRSISLPCKVEFFPLQAIRAAHARAGRLKPCASFRSTCRAEM